MEEEEGGPAAEATEPGATFGFADPLDLSMEVVEDEVQA